jgi:hypothetical protein
MGVSPMGAAGRIVHSHLFFVHCPMAGFRFAWSAVGQQFGGHFICQFPFLIGHSSLLGIAPATMKISAANGFSG